MAFVGREYELEELEALYRSPRANLVVIYGRRRVGKSTLVEQFIANKPHVRFEGLEKVKTPGQIAQVNKDIVKYIDDPLLKSVKFDSWNVIFDYFVKYFSHQPQKCVLFLDEFQWLAANRTKLVSLIKSYWDQYWSKQNVMIILCGSVSSYMVKRVLRSKALYGRINWELCLAPFSPNEIYQLLDQKRSKSEILLYSMILGGIPKYLQEIDPNKSFDQNINKLLFTRSGKLVNEYQKVFYSQFGEYKIYESICHHLIDRPLSFDEISNKTDITSGGGLSRYLKNLENAAFITMYVPYDKTLESKLKKYKLTDEYLRFYFKYVEARLKLIATNTKRNLFAQLVKPVWQPWLGYAFENFCMKNAIYLAELMGFGDQVLEWGPVFQRSDDKFQVDLLYVRLDKVITLCELKLRAELINVSIVQEVERKCSLISVPKGYTLERALISQHGPDESLKALKYFHHSITVDDFFDHADG